MHAGLSFIALLSGRLLGDEGSSSPPLASRVCVSNHQICERSTLELGQSHRSARLRIDEDMNEIAGSGCNIFSRAK